MMPNPCTPTCPDRRAGTRTTPPCQTDCPRRAAFLVEREQLRTARNKARVLDKYFGDLARKRGAIKPEAQCRRRLRWR